MRLTSTATLALLLAPAIAEAETPRIVTDVAPVHSLVSMVMGDLGTPDLLVEGVVDAHAVNLRPSQAAMLQEADVLIHVGIGLTPWIEGALDGLAADTVQLSMLDTGGWSRLDRRDGAVFGLEVADTGHDHDHDAHEHGDDHDHDDHGHDDHDEHEHEEAKESGHDDHAHDDHGHDHDHGDGADPHAWLSPAVAGAWVGVIAETLVEADPENAATYRANADAAKARLTALEAELAATLAPVQGRTFVVAHDALQYFEVAFDIPAAGALAAFDAENPGPQRIQALQEMISENGIACVLTDPTVDQAWAELLTETTDARTAFVDPLGGDQEPGPGHYAATLRGIAETLAGCLAD